jgi:hypothetical protein
MRKQPSTERGRRHGYTADNQAIDAFRVARMSANRWRRALAAGGRAALL